MDNSQNLRVGPGEVGNRARIETIQITKWRLFKQQDTVKSPGDLLSPNCSDGPSVYVDVKKKHSFLFPRKQKWEEKQLYGRFKRLINNISHQKTCTGLRKGHYKRET